MGGNAKNGAGAELLHSWGNKTDHREKPWRGWDGTWFYPPLEGDIKDAGFTDVRTSINRRKNTFAKYIATQPLMDLCEGKTQRGGARVAMMW